MLKNAKQHPKKASTSKSIDKKLDEMWNNPVSRGWIYQGIVVLLLIWCGTWLFTNTLDNLKQQGISSGFGFLSREAGFGIVQTLIPYSEASSFLRSFWVSILNTIFIAACGIIFATILGFSVGIMRLSSNGLVRGIATVYVEMFRNVPLLLQILFWYVAVLKPLPRPLDVFERGEEISFALTNRGITFATPIPESGFSATVITFTVMIIGCFILSKWAKRRQAVTGKTFPIFYTQLGMVILVPLLVFMFSGRPLHFEPAVMGRFRAEGGSLLIIEFIALFLALSIYSASFIAETVRAGIQSVSYGQTEASSALGLKTWQTTRLVVIPQAMRVIIPPLTNQYLNLTKNSSLAAAIAYPDLVSVFAGTALNTTGQAIEIMGMTLAVYLVLSLGTSVAMNRYNQRIMLVTR